MALTVKHKDTTFGVGDVVRVHKRLVEEGKKSRTQIFEGVVIAIKNRGSGKSFTVRRIGAQNIGIEQIFPLESSLIEKIEVKQHGLRGVRRAKLYYIRDKSKKEIDRIYSRASRKSS